MFFSLGVLTNAAWLVLGTIWCREMLGRWRGDLDEWRSTEDTSARWVLALLWMATALVGLGLVNSLWGILRNIGLLA